MIRRTIYRKYKTLIYIDGKLTFIIYKKLITRDRITLYDAIHSINFIRQKDIVVICVLNNIYYNNIKLTNNSSYIIISDQDLDNMDSYISLKLKYMSRRLSR